MKDYSLVPSHSPIQRLWSQVISHHRRELQPGTTTLPFPASLQLSSQRAAALYYNILLSSISAPKWYVSPSQRTAAWCHHTFLSSVSEAGWYLPRDLGPLQTDLHTETGKQQPRKQSPIRTKYTTCMTCTNTSFVIVYCAELSVVFLVQPFKVRVCQHSDSDQ